MDWNFAIDRNREALKRVLSMLVAMVEMGTGGEFILFPHKAAAAQSTARAGKSRPSPAFALPRHLHRAILKLLYPAEAAARRLIIVAARGLAVTMPPLRSRKPQHPIRRRSGGTAASVPSRIPSLPLFDPLRAHRPWSGSIGRASQGSVPRISLFGENTTLQSLPPRASKNDPASAARLGLRLQALSAALDDLPGQAKRFARWQLRAANSSGAPEKSPGGECAQDQSHAGMAKQGLGGDEATEHEKLLDAIGARRRARKAMDASGRKSKPARTRRIGPLKPGRPPGWRRKSVHEVHDVLNDLHGLALWALGSPDSS